MLRENPLRTCKVRISFQHEKYTKPWLSKIEHMQRNHTQERDGLLKQYQQEKYKGVQKNKYKMQ